MRFKTYMNLFSKKFKCDKCESKFPKYEDLISHARHEHHHEIIKCTECGKEFIHEADRLHHARKEHEKKMFNRVHKSGNKKDKKSTSIQDNVDKFTGHFSDKL